MKIVHKITNDVKRNIHMLKTAVFSILIILSFSSIVWAETYYVDFLNGSDSNSGLSISTPWQHSPGDDNATGTADSTSLSAGDKVIFKGGVEYLGTVENRSWSGSGDAENQRIIYQGNTDAKDWGTGKAIIDCENKRIRAFNIVSKDYITIRNFEVKNFLNASNLGTLYVRINGVNQDYTYSSGFGSMQGAIYIDSCNYIDVEDCIMHTAQHWDHECTTQAEAIAVGKSWNDDVPAQTRGLDVVSSTYVDISGCEFYELGRDGMRIVNSSYVWVRDCDFGGTTNRSNKGWFSVAIRVNGGHHLYIQGNTMHDGWQYGGDNAAGSRCHGNDWNHYYGTYHDLYFERNFLYNNKDLSLSGDYRGAAFVYGSDASYNNYIRNNIFVQPVFPSGAVLFNTGCYNIEIDNNTFVRWNSVNSNSPLIALSVPIDSNDSIKNNIFIDYEESTASMIIRNTTTMDTSAVQNNVYYAPNRTFLNRENGDVFTWSQWVAAGYDTINGASGDPNLTNVPANASTASSGDYSISSSSSLCIDLGATLSGFSNDYKKISRPQGSAWDIGAYEGAPVLSAPTGLQIKN